MIGSREYTNSVAIKNLIFKFIQVYGNELEIVSGEQPKGADGYVRKHALDLGAKYVSFPPRHFQWNQYCPNPPYEYGKPYKVWYFHERNTEIVDYSTKFIIFKPKWLSIEKSTGSFDVYKKVKKANKFYVIVNGG